MIDVDYYLYDADIKLYKLFMKMVTKRNTKNQDFYKPVEQAGFQSYFSANDHLQVMRTLIEKRNEYKIGIAFTFIYYEKTFDSIEAWSRLDERRVDSIIRKRNVVYKTT